MIKIIVATTENGIIGKDGQLPWNRQSTDMTRFREITLDHPVIMGRSTYESIPFDLDRREQIVLTRSGCIGQGKKFCGFPNTHVASNGNEALSIASKFKEDCFVIGGGQVYDLFIDEAHEIYLTIIHTKTQGDVSFVVPSGFRKESSEYHGADQKNQFPYTFEFYRRS